MKHVSEEKILKPQFDNDLLKQSLLSRASFIERKGMYKNHFSCIVLSQIREALGNVTFVTKGKNARIIFLPLMY